MNNHVYTCRNTFHVHVHVYMALYYMYMYAMQGMAGMTDTQFDGKMKQLETERQQRIQV